MFSLLVRALPVLYLCFTTSVMAVEYTSPIEGDNMRLVPTDSSMEQCNDYNADTDSPEVQCPAGEYVVDVWADGWSTHVVKGITVNLGGSSDLDANDNSNAIVSYTSPMEGDNMRLVPTDSTMEQCNDYNADTDSPEVQCPAGEYVVDVWANGWNTHVVKGITVNLGGGMGGNGTEDSTDLPRNRYNRIAGDNRVLDFEHLENTRSENLPFKWRVSNGGARGNQYYSFFNEGDINNVNDEMFTTISEAVNAGSSSPDYRTNSHRVADNPTGDVLGDFRIKCQWSHFAYDDPIVFSNPNPNDDYAPGPNKAHLHMFWGNTAINWETELVDKGDDNHIAARGGSSCNGGALNRSSYWMPALMHNNDHVMTPQQILVYYKTWQTDVRTGEVQHDPEDTNRMPQGLQLIAGNGNLPDGTYTESDADRARNLNLRNQDHGARNTNENIYWACGDDDGSNVNPSVA